jgi:type I restriction enzyme R subunit
MVISIDKLTAVRMYEKVRRHWQQRLASLRARLAIADELERPDLESLLEFMAATEMAVVISQEQNEIDKFREKGLEIEPHRWRMVTEDLETKFKDPDDPFRLVFVCAMWMTGFDAPDCSTIYLDKPMRNHDHRPGQPGFWPEEQQPDCGLHRRFPRLAAGLSHLRLGLRRRGPGGRAAG